MSKVLEMIERVRDGEDARKVVRGLEKARKDEENASEGLREHTEQFLARNRKRGI